MKLILTENTVLRKSVHVIAKGSEPKCRLCVGAGLSVFLELF